MDRYGFVSAATARGVKRFSRHAARSPHAGRQHRPEPLARRLRLHVAPRIPNPCEEPP